MFETIPFQFDLNRLLQHIESHVLHLPPAMMPDNYGGWSVLSATGSYTDGWVTSGVKVDATSIAPSRDEIKDWFKKMGLRATREYVNHTEICTGYLREVVDTIQKTGINPCRVRIIRLVANGSTTWHRDSPDSIAAYRLHVPIVSNPNCYFEYESTRRHLAPTGEAYVIQVNKIHRVVNFGTTDRLHLVMDIYDPEKIIGKSADQICQLIASGQEVLHSL